MLESRRMRRAIAHRRASRREQPRRRAPRARLAFHEALGQDARAIRKVTSIFLFKGFMKCQPCARCASRLAFHEALGQDARAIRKVTSIFLFGIQRGLNTME